MLGWYFLILIILSILKNSSDAIAVLVKFKMLLNVSKKNKRVLSDSFHSLRASVSYFVPAHASLQIRVQDFCTSHTSSDVMIICRFYHGETTIE